jgi:hypothetical protein
MNAHQQPGLFDEQARLTLGLGVPRFTDPSIVARFWDLPTYAQALIRAQPGDAVINLDWLYHEAECWQKQANAYQGEMHLFSRDRADALRCAIDILLEQPA